MAAVLENVMMPLDPRELSGASAVKRQKDGFGTAGKRTQAIGRRGRAFGAVEPLESRHLLASDIVINELHYDPADRNVPSEFIEIYNAGDTTADLSGWRFTDGIDFTFAQGTSVGPNQYAVVVQDLDGFAVEFGRPRGKDAIAYQIEERTRGNESYEGSLGMDFIVKHPIVVTELGVFDSDSRGLRRTIKAEIWSRDDSGTPSKFDDDTGTSILAEHLFTSDDEGTLVGGSRFKAVPNPVTLPPGDYSVVAFGYGSREGNFNGEGAPAGSTSSGDGLVSFVGSSRRGEAGMFPESVDSGPTNQYGAGTFRFSSAELLAPFGEPIGTWSGKLANDGERVVLRDNHGNVIDQVSYDVGFPWPTASQGEGASMELIHPRMMNLMNQHQDTQAASVMADWSFVEVVRRSFLPIEALTS